MILRESRIILAALLLGLAYLCTTLTAEAATDTYTTSTGARAFASYPDTANRGDQFHVNINADAGSGTIVSFPTAPSGWNLVGCTFVAQDTNGVSSTSKSITVRLNMTRETCSFYVEITWGNAVGQQNAVTTITGTIVTDNQDQNLFAKQVIETFAWVVWLGYTVLVYRLKPTALRGVGVVVGWSILFLPIGPLQYVILAAAQLALTLYVFVETTWK
jgi:hypothetical protein